LQGAARLQAVPLPVLERYEVVARAGGAASAEAHAAASMRKAREFMNTPPESDNRANPMPPIITCNEKLRRGKTLEPVVGLWTLFGATLAPLAFARGQGV